MPRYREQYERMLRWYNRFAIIDQGRLHEVSSDNYLDEIYAFFLNCYHLKDWIRNDESIDETIGQDVENYINSNRDLRICADICNSLKHLRLDRSRSEENPIFGKKVFSLKVGTQPTVVALKYEIDTKNGPLDAFQLATNCVEAWKTFLIANNLL